MASDHSWKGAPDISVLQELLKALNDPAFLILIHLDQNSGQHYKDAVSLMIEERPRATLVKQQLRCSWGGASLTPHWSVTNCAIGADLLILLETG